MQTNLTSADSSTPCTWSSSHAHADANRCVCNLAPVVQIHRHNESTVVKVVVVSVDSLAYHDGVAPTTLGKQTWI